MSGIETVTISTPGREPITMTGEQWDDATKRILNGDLRVDPDTGEVSVSPKGKGGDDKAAPSGEGWKGGAKKRKAAVVDPKKVARLACKNWWSTGRTAEGVALQSAEDGDGVWIADGWTAWRLVGNDAEWMRLTLEADAIDRGAAGLADSDIGKVVDTALDGALALSATNLFLDSGDKGKARVFVGPGPDDVVFVQDAYLTPIGDVMELQWRGRGPGAPIIASTLTDTLCVIMPLYIPGQHGVLAKAWRAWNGDGSFDDEVVAPAQGVMDDPALQVDEAQK